MKSFSILICLCALGFNSLSQDKVNAKSLRNETMLHPGDASTGYTYHRGEFGYNQAITPYPSWGWWGITDRITAELDFEAWLGGVPSFNFRFGILKENKWKPALSFETMYQYLDKERDQFHNLDYLEVLRHGSNWYNHINASWHMKQWLHIHVSGGATYAQNLSISNGDTINYVGESFSNLISPDASVSIDWRATAWLGLQTTASYGSTFLYADNIARKTQFTFAGRFAPFYKSNWGILNCFRIELAVLHANFADADTSITGPIGFIYWQWDWSKERREELKKARQEKRK